MQLLVITCLLGCVIAMATGSPTSATDLEEEFESYLLKHGKTYDADEHQLRFKIFADTHKLISEHNQRHALNQTSYSMAINQFADLMQHEYPKGYAMNTSSVSRPGYRTQEPRDNVNSTDPLPATVDWVLQGAVTPVKDQKRCGSCWAFSTTGTLEGQHFRKTGKLLSLSEQNLVDCAGRFGTDGCQGGFPDRALEYVLENGGIDTEQSYLYTGEDGRCRFQKKTVGATVKAIAELPEGNETDLQTAVAHVGPVSVAIDASHRSFMFYHSGVYDERECSSTFLDHAVLVVGYGTDETGGDYWLVKNSWTQHWGDKGYIRMSRNKGNQCGIASKACYPVV